MPKRKAKDDDDDGDDDFSPKKKGKGKAAKPAPKSKGPAAAKAAKSPAPKGKHADPMSFPQDKAASMERNTVISQVLAAQAEIEKNRPESNFWSAKAISGASTAVSTASFAISSGKQAMACLAGVGKGVAYMIDTIIDSGTLPEVGDLPEDPRLVALVQLQRVHGIDSKQAAVLHDDVGITSLAALSTRLDVLTPAQRIAFQYLAEFEVPVPRVETAAIESELVAAAHAIDPRLEVHVCGAYRRNQPEDSHISVVLTHPAYVAPDAARPESAASGPGMNYASLLTSVITRLGARGLISDCMSASATEFEGAVLLSEGGSSSGSSSSSSAAPSAPDATAKFQAQLNTVSAASAPAVPATSAASSSSSSASSCSLFDDLEIPDEDAVLSHEDSAVFRARNADAASERAAAEAARAAETARKSKSSSTASSAASVPAAAAAAAAPVFELRLPSGPLHHRLEIRYVPYNCLAPALLNFTGPPAYVNKLRAEAKKRNFSLSEFALRPIVEVVSISDDDDEAIEEEDGEPPAAAAAAAAASNTELGSAVSVKSEVDIYRAIGVPSVPPSNRVE